MKSSDFHCPFCEQRSPRPQGLAAHIRSRHPKQYPKWLKVPTRIVDAQKTVAAPESIEQPAEPSTVPSPAAVPALLGTPEAALRVKYRWLSAFRSW